MNWRNLAACGLLVAGSIKMAGDILARRWTDIIWTSNPLARRMGGHQVKYVYYSILALYCVWGLVALWLFKPLMIEDIPMTVATPITTPSRVRNDRRVFFRSESRASSRISLIAQSHNGIEIRRFRRRIDTEE